MLKKILRCSPVVALFLAAGVVTAGGALKSGPQTGDKVPGPFHPLNLTGASAGEKHCLFCERGGEPTVMIFARESSPAITKLLKQVDASTAQNSKAGLGSFVVFLSDNKDLPDQLKTLAQKESIKQTVLSIDNPPGPQNYKVAPEAEVTVILYNDFTVAANHTFRKGELNDQGITKVVSDVAKILPRK